MIDYLSNLVARELGKIEPVQPRLASRFEPPQAAHPGVERELREDARTPDAQETGDEFGTGMRAPADPSPGAPPNLTRAPRTPSRANATGEEPHAGNSFVVAPIRVQFVGRSPAAKDSTPGQLLETAPSSSSIRRTHDDSDDATVRSSDEVTGALARARSARADEAEAIQGSLVSTLRAPQSFAARPAEPPPVSMPGTASASASLKPSVEDRQAASLTSEQPTLVSAGHDDRPRQSSDAPRASRPSSHAETEAASSLRAHETAAAGGVFAQPRTTRSTETTANEQAASTETVEAAPVINVTIGRVEIRAVQTPAAPRKPGAAAPPMNLDDYLRSRAGGGVR